MNVNLWEIPKNVQVMWMVANLIKAYYTFESTGGTCHIILDDGNYDDHSVDFCIKYAEENEDMMGLAIASMLKLLTVEEREHVCETNIDQLEYEVELGGQKIFSKRLGSL